jgi:hypothetical protein
MKKDCRYQIGMDVPRRPANALCIEVGTPATRCTMKPPENWKGTGVGAVRWLGSGGSPLVFGVCSADCPLDDDPGDIDNDDPMLYEGSDYGTGNEWP